MPAGTDSAHRHRGRLLAHFYADFGALDDDIHALNALVLSRRSCRTLGATWLGRFRLDCLRSVGCTVLVALLFVTFLLPTLGFVPFTYQTYSTVADRHVYLALIGVGLMELANGALAQVMRASAMTAEDFSDFGIALMKMNQPGRALQALSTAATMDPSSSCRVR